MQIDLTFNNPVKFRGGSKPFFQNIISTAANALILNQSFGLSINLVSSATIKKLNTRHRGIAKSTDVLAFPVQTKTDLSRSASDAILELGDIFICLVQAQSDARAEAVTLQRKLAELTVHGFLHLLGYDHTSSAPARETMFNLQAKIISLLP